MTAGTTTKKVSPKEFSDAREFLDALSLDKWTSPLSWSCPWVFRGQQSSSWDLKPSAWRPPETVALKQLASIRSCFARDCGDAIRKQLYRNPLTEWADGDAVVKAYAQARAEFALLLQFVQLSDELGHRVPDIDAYLRLAHYDYIPNVQHFPLVRFLPEVNAASALAQHHGVPTRSLDCTKNPLYAAYFAASEVDSDNDPGSIAVWALRPDLLLEAGRDEKFNAGYSRFLCQTVPSGDNPYLRSQEGLFVCPSYGCAYIAKTGDFPDLEDFACNAQELAGTELIQKLTLPYSQVGELLRLLWLRRVSRAHLMPTLDNVSQALDSRWKWSI